MKTPNSPSMMVVPNVCITGRIFDHMYNDFQTYATETEGLNLYIWKFLPYNPEVFWELIDLGVDPENIRLINYDTRIIDFLWGKTYTREGWYEKTFGLEMSQSC